MRRLTAWMAWLGTMAVTSLAMATLAPSAVPLAELDVAQMRQDWGKPGKNLSVDGHPLSIAGTSHASGLGTHSTSRLDLDVRGATRFRAVVGVDDDAERGRSGDNGRASVEFVVLGDGKPLFRSGVMHVGDAGKPVDVSLAGVKRLSLIVSNGGDSNIYDHADWADATFDVDGEPPVAIDRSVVAAQELASAPVLTPKARPEPRINGARVFGARPGSPILIHVPVTGTRPISVSIGGALPPGLELRDGNLVGSVAAKGEYAITLHAKNSAGESRRLWKLIIDDAPGALAKTPPMGWNSWNVWGMAIDDAKVRAAADAFVSSGLIDHGWTYINLDDGWANRGRGSREADFDGETRNADGSVRPNRKFPDMKALADYVHGRGLKVGIYSSPGPRTCGGVEGSYGYEAEDAKQYAAWGIDYLKYDWCAYGEVAALQRRSTKFDEHAIQMRPYEVMRDELRQQPRDIVYSLCQYGMNDVWTWGAEVDGQLWRTTDDINDSWSSMSGIGFGQAGKENFAGPGRWNDPDMLVVGHVGWGPNVRPSKLSPDEQYTHVSLWALLSAPLLIGCDLTKLDPFTLGLLTNDEVININQDPLGKQASRIRKDGDLEVWTKPLEDGDVAIGLFNRGEAPAEVSVDFDPSTPSLRGPLELRDVWRQQSLGPLPDSYKAAVAPHGVVLLRISPAGR